jgi:hypothetical protein
MKRLLIAAVVAACAVPAGGASRVVVVELFSGIP